MKILFLTPQLPYPPNTGGTIKSYKMVKYLFEHHQLTICTLLKGDDANYEDEFKKKVSCEDYGSIKIDIPRTAINFLKSVFLSMPLNIFRNFNNIFQAMVEEKSLNQDIIFIDHYLMYQYVPASFKKKVILHQHNAEHIMWQRFAMTEQNIIKKSLLIFESWRIKNYEKQICKLATNILAAPNDIEILTELGIDKNKFYTTYHLSNESYLNMPKLKYDGSIDALMYVGTLSWEANIDGLAWFLTEGWDNLKVRIPNLKFYIIGKNPDTRLKEIVKEKKDVILTGFVDDLEEYFIKCKIFVAPLRFGSGMKVKVISAMSRGIPVVTTSIGSEGIDIVDMKHLSESDNIAVFIKRIEQLLVEKDTWELLSQESRRLIETKYTWNIVFEKLEEAISD